MADHGWDDEPYAFIHPWIDPVVMAGNGTIGLEILEDVPQVETIFVPVGGGGLSSGIGTAVKTLRPDVRVVAVEPEGCCALSQSLEAGKPMSVTCDTICDGVAVPFVVPEVFEILREVIDDVVLVSDTDVKRMIKRLALRNKIVTEGAGALAATAALATLPERRGLSVAIVSGGSIDPDFLATILTDPDLD
jgi:threonine dehydratase